MKRLRLKSLKPELQELIYFDFSIQSEQIALGSIVISGIITLPCIILSLIVNIPRHFLVFPGILFFGINIFLLHIYPRHYQKQADEINSLFPLFRNCIEMYLSILPKDHDVCTFLISFLASIPSPIQDTFKRVQQSIQQGNLPEKILLSYKCPSSLLEEYLKALLLSKYHSQKSSLMLDTPLENRYKIYSHSLESRISIIFFLGLFIPLGFSLGVFLQKINGILLLSSSPILFILLLILTRKITTDNLILLGTVSRSSKSLKIEYLVLWDFFYRLSTNLMNMAPETALIQAIESTNLIQSSAIRKYLYQLKSYTLPLEEFLNKFYKTLQGARIRLVFSTLIFMITSSCEVTSEKLFQLLLVLKHHRELESQRLQTLKGEMFKVKSFQIILPIIISLMTTLFLLISSNISPSSFLFSFSMPLTNKILFSVNQLISAHISIYFFRRAVGLRYSMSTIIYCTVFFLLVALLGLILFNKFPFVF
ncbi:MAG: hypothetical protein JW776_02835 [Candidatus Lokiarchaeota archaeon]|nr:hypothetical protein [Candidatus Lokiarchaeota archaeon]